MNSRKCAETGSPQFEYLHMGAILDDVRSVAFCRTSLNRGCILSAAFLAISLLGLGISHAQGLAQKEAAPKEDEAMARARAAFEALPEVERRAIQDNLVWTGIYKSGVDGGFGRLTFNAMRAYTSKRPGAAEAILSPQDRAALAAEAAKAKSAAGFALLQEPLAGVAIGVPQKLFTHKSAVGAGARYDSADKSAGLETFRMREGETSLQTLYDAYRAPAPNRRITYSVIRPDFLVVSAETPARASYTRVAKGAAGTDVLLRGFTISWPKAQQARYEILAVAIANSFDPFGQQAALAKALDGKAPAPGGRPGTAPLTITAPRSASLVASAIAFAPNRYAAVLREPACEGARIGNRPARLMRHDPGLELALFDVPGGTGTRLRAAATGMESGVPAVLIFSEPGELAAQAVTSVGVGELAQVIEGAAARVRAPLPASAAGGLVLSRKGGLYGLVAPAPAAARRVAGAPPPASREILRAEQLSAFLAVSGLELVPAQANAQDASTGKIAADNRGSIEALWCEVAAAVK